MAEDLEQALCMLAGYDPARAHELRCQLAKRFGRAGEITGVLSYALEAQPALDTISDATKAKVAISSVRQLLVCH